jgi:hypothetical protein
MRTPARSATSSAHIGTIIEHMFDEWRLSDEYPTLFLLSRPVWVDTARVLPASGIRQDELPLWVRASGLRLEPRMAGTQRAWVRRSDGGWISVVDVAAASGNGQSRVDMTLWLPPEVITVDGDAAR